MIGALTPLAEKAEVTPQPVVILIITIFTILSYYSLSSPSSPDLGCLASSQDIERHLEQGKKLLAAGQFADALIHYHMAIGRCRRQLHKC